MARLLIKNQDLGGRVLDLRMGVNRLGRSSENDFPIEHPTISAFHCEIEVADGEVSVRDCGSTNGTYLAGEQIEEAVLRAGQTLWLGDVEFLVESTEVKIAIPKIEAAQAPEPVMLEDGSLGCPRHPGTSLTHRCTHCGEAMCSACVHSLRRRGGKWLQLCPLCNHPCEAIGPKQPTKTSILDILQKTVRLPLIGGRRRRR